MLRRYVQAGLAALCLGLVATTDGCGGSGLTYPSVAIFTVSGTTISPATSDVVAGGTVEINNTNSTNSETVTFSSVYTTPWVIPPSGYTDVPLPTVTTNTAVTLTVTGGNSAVLNIHVD
jgi:hypothetical protein